MALEVYFVRILNGRRDKLLRAQATYEEESLRRRRALVEEFFPGSAAKDVDELFWECPEGPRQRVITEIALMGLELGLNEEGELIYDLVRKQSSTNPAHLFEVGFFRSSYSTDGFNSVMRAVTGEDLGTIFQPPPGEADFRPDWKACLERARRAREEFGRKGVGMLPHARVPWYSQAIRIVIESIEHVLQLPARQREAIWVHWDKEAPSHA